MRSCFFSSCLCWSVRRVRAALDPETPPRRARPTLACFGADVRMWPTSSSNLTSRRLPASVAGADRNVTLISEPSSERNMLGFRDRRSSPSFSSMSCWRLGTFEEHMSVVASWSASQARRRSKALDSIFCSRDMRFSMSW